MKHDSLPLMHDIDVGNFTTTPRIVIDFTKPLTAPVTASQQVADLVVCSSIPSREEHEHFLLCIIPKPLEETTTFIRFFYIPPGGNVPEADHLTSS